MILQYKSTFDVKFNIWYNDRADNNKTAKEYAMKAECEVNQNV